MCDVRHISRIEILFSRHCHFAPFLLVCFSTLYCWAVAVAVATKVHIVATFIVAAKRSENSPFENSDDDISGFVEKNRKFFCMKFLFFGLFFSSPIRYSLIRRVVDKAAKITFAMPSSPSVACQYISALGSNSAGRDWYVYPSALRFIKMKDNPRKCGRNLFTNCVGVDVWQWLSWWCDVLCMWMWDTLTER